MAKSMDPYVRSALEFDPFDMVRKAVGDTVPVDVANGLGVSLFMENNRTKRALLAKTNDIWFGAPIDVSFRVFEQAGFEKILDIPFDHLEQGEPNGTIEHYYLFWNPNVGLIQTDTHTMGEQANLNSIDLCFAWKANPNEKRYWGNGSGGFFDPTNREEPRMTEEYSQEAMDRFYQSQEYLDYEAHWRANAVWVGHKDVREGLRFHISDLSRRGQFLPLPKFPMSWMAPWVASYEKKEPGSFEPYYRWTRKVLSELTPEHRKSIFGSLIEIPKEYTEVL